MLQQLIHATFVGGKKKKSPYSTSRKERERNQGVLSQGAEAKIFLDKNKELITKDRTPKSYRIKILDDKIRKSRTKSETKLLEKASKIINVPLPQKSEDNFKIILPFIDGKKLSQHLEEFSLERQKQILKQIGKDVAKLHDAGIIHGDLTTSNMILVEDNYNLNEENNSKPIQIAKQRKKEVISTNNSLSGGRAISRVAMQSNSSGVASWVGTPNDNLKIYFIDFGLGFFNGKFEDKAVDLHLLKQALEAKHFSHWQENYQSFLEGYKNSKDYEKIINQLIKVEKRGRYRH